MGFAQNDSRKALNRLVLSGMVIAWASHTVPAAERTTFNRPFAPQEGLVAAVEKPVRQELSLNGHWQFQPVALPAGFQRNLGRAPELTPPLADRWDAVPIRIPSPWNINAFPYGTSQKPFPGGDFRTFPSYPAAWEDVKMAWMRRTFTVPADWKNGQRIILHFDAVNGSTQVLVNGKAVGENFDNFLPFEFDITDVLKADGENEVLVGVRRAELFDNEGKVGRRPYVAGSMWAEDVAGIWQDVTLLALPAVRVSDLLVRPEVDADRLGADLTLTNDTEQPQQVTVAANVQPWVNLAAADPLDAPAPKWRLDPSVLTLESKSVEIPARGKTTVKLDTIVGDKLKLWSPESPSLYGLTFDVRAGERVLDRRYQRFGYRQLKQTANGVELNGKPVTFKGDAWHFLGVPQMTRRYAWAWYQAAKAANCNAVRLHAQPYPKFYLDVADEVGLFVLDETGIWGSDASPKLDSAEYWQRADDHVTRLVLRDRNHPSVMGYSITNEVLVIMRTRGASQESMKRVFDWYTAQVEKIKTLDPTRQWVSGDGDDDAEGRLPVFIGHYGGFTEPKNWSKKGKPWGVGECGMAYYGTPKQVAQYNGPLSYESMQGRQDGLAREAYKLIVETHRNLNATYSSVFNVVWYGLKPLPLGLSDTSRAPTIDDGIWFDAFEEGKPGMQPERLGPYCTTLNPGYDPKLPLYQTWPMFDAIKAANAPEVPAATEYSQTRGQQAPAAVASPVTPTSSVSLLAGADDAAKQELNLLGVTEKPAGSGDSAVLMISGQSAPPADAKAQVDRVLAAGGTVIVWRPASIHLPAINAILPQVLELNERTCTSLLPAANDPLTAGLTAADFYYTELQPNLILESGLAGALVKSGKVILRAPMADWRRWNGQPEIIKTGSLARSEAETQSDGVAMVVTPAGKGRVIVANLSNSSAFPQRATATRRLLTNMGIALAPERELIGGGIFTNTGVLRKALVLGRYPNEQSAQDPKGSMPNPAVALPPGEVRDNPRRGQKVGDATWHMKEADTNFTFNFLEPDLSGSVDNAAAYVSFWINSPRGLDDVLGEPDVPRLSLVLGGEGWANGGVWLNGKAIEAERADGTRGRVPLVLKRGWNHIVLRMTHGVGEWDVKASLRTSRPEFLAQLQAAAESPQ